MDRPKTELAYRVPASKLTRRKLDQGENPEELEAKTGASVFEVAHTIASRVCFASFPEYKE